MSLYEHLHKEDRVEDRVIRFSLGYGKEFAFGIPFNTTT